MERRCLLAREIGVDRRPLVENGVFNVRTPLKIDDVV